MNRQCWDFTLLDTGFFRSGQPFHAGEGGHSRIVSHFPPPMRTLQGATRSALAAAADGDQVKVKAGPMSLEMPTAWAGYLCKVRIWC